MRTITPNAEQRARLNSTRASVEATQEREHEHHVQLRSTAHRTIAKTVTLEGMLIAGINECRNGSYATKVVNQVKADRQIKRLTAPIGMLCRNK